LTDMTARSIGRRAAAMDSLYTYTLGAGCPSGKGVEQLFGWGRINDGST
jgi:hypothetical protein